MERLRGFYSKTEIFDEKHRESTLRLYQDVFGYKDYSPYIQQLILGDTSGWVWRYEKNDSVRLVALQEDGEVVGHLGATIKDVQVGDLTIRGAEIIEGVVKPSLRGGITLYKLIKEIRHQLIDVSGVDFAILFPNSFSAGTVLRRATAQREAFLLERPLTGIREEAFIELNDDEFLSLAPALYYRRLFANPGTGRTVE